MFARLEDLLEEIVRAGEIMVQTIRSGKKILVCGNGGSAADAQHFAAEMVGRFKRERAAWPVIAMTTDTSILTALSNDYSFNFVFARQVEALAQERDLLLGISTSGESTNVLLAVEAAREKQVKTVSLLGRDGGRITSVSNIVVVVPEMATARIQEAHGFILHAWCAMLEEELASS